MKDQAQTHGTMVYADMTSPPKNKHKSPNIKLMTEVIISPLTKIYIKKGRDPETARLIWLENHINCSY